MKDALKENLQPLENLGTIRLNKIPSKVYGSCNFCSNYNEFVNEISGKNLIVRICDKCFDSIQKQKEMQK